MSRELVTPVILTYNEDSNIQSTLASLTWVPRIVLLDSGSTDRTEEIARSFGNVSWFVRAFDNHASQWSYGIHQTAIDTEYVLALDADMVLGAGFQDELGNFLRLRKFAGARVPFEYRVVGRRLLSSIYPAQVRIFRKDAVSILQAGHTQAFRVPGPTYAFRAKLIHEDRKPIDRWLGNQIKYAKLEASRIIGSRRRNMKDRVRLLGLSPLVWGAYAYFRAGGPFRHAPSRAYAYERLIFEAILSRLLTHDPASSSNPSRDPSNSHCDSAY